ncbi:MAG TPA: DUF58 domain-containing protein [Anaerolineales bacterium]|nr:DUF58 domain-containing protein [Anaerolineales bacterium]
MVGTFLPLLVLLLVIAAFLRGGFALTLIYLVVGALAAGLWWSRRAVTQLQTRREFTHHAFLGEEVQVDLQVENKGWLPVPWLELRESLPVALVGPNSFQSVIQLGPRATANFAYTVEARKRGYYPIGPLSMTTGDILGFSDALMAQTPAEALVVYPRIVTFTSAELPSQSPQGTLRHRLPLFEDPTRLFGKRAYTSGDSLRRIDWKSSASSGRLQVKLFEPSIALSTCVLLNLRADDYYYRSRIDSTELAIVIAASLSNWIVERKQRVGLLVNGRDPLTIDGQPPVVPPRKGKRHLMQLLEILARAESADVPLLAPFIQTQRFQLPWGTTLMVISGLIGEHVLDELYQARRAGMNPLLILAGRDTADEAGRQRAAVLGIPVIDIATERDLSLWMQSGRGA